MWVLGCTHAPQAGARVVDMSAVRGSRLKELPAAGCPAIAAQVGRQVGSGPFARCGRNDGRQ